MKKENLIIKILIGVFMEFVFLYNVNAKTVSLNELYEIRNDNEQLNEVTQVNIEHDDNLDYVNILSNLPNLSYLYILQKSIDDFTFINNIEHEFSIFCRGGRDIYVNLNGVNNQYLKSLSFSAISIHNFSNINDLKNLKELFFGYITNYDEINYRVLSKFTELEKIEFESTGIIDYQQFFDSINQLNKLKILNLQMANIQNKDTEYLKANSHLKELYLEGTLITDISFLKDMPNVESIKLPPHITDFNILYELENLKEVWWDDYTEYNVTNELVQYLDSKNISHSTFYPIKNIIDELVNDANILDYDDDLTKLLKIVKVAKNFAIASLDPIDSYIHGGQGSNLSLIVLNRKGVCENWSSLIDTLLNIVGVESYKVSGPLIGVNNSFEFHAWNIIKINDKTYAIDVMNANPEPYDYFDITTWKSSFKSLMLRDPIRVDSYREIDSKNNNLDYNYNFPFRYVETDGFERTKMSYEFKNIDNVVNISQKNIWIDLNTNISSLNLVPTSGYSYEYYDSVGNVKNTGIAETGDYIIVTSSNNANYSHKYEIIVEEKSYEIKLESDSFGKNESITVKNGGKYVGLFTPIKYCYKFLGWYTEKNGGTLITEDSIVDISKVDTLYAHWQFDNKYILTVHPGGIYQSSTYIFEPNDIYYNVKKTTDDYSKPQLYNANFARPSGKKFSGFYTEKDGGNLLTYYSTVVTNSNHSIYAHYVDESDELYTVSLKCTGCNLNTTFTWPVEPNTKISKFYNPTREGYTFKYWSLNGSEFDFNTPVTSDITLVAEWEEVEETLKDILEDNGHTVNNNFVSKFTLGETVTQIKNKLGNGVTIETDRDIIATGAVIKKGTESYTVVIKGDLTGDGRVNSGDLLQMRKHLLEEINLTGAYKEAGIIESVGNIKSLDLLRLRQYLLDEYEFN